jgi:hypothetical protein
LGRQNAALAAAAAVARSQVTPQFDAHKETLLPLRIDCSELFIEMKSVKIKTRNCNL